MTPSESSSVYVSGDTVGIYMETEGVLVIDTGEILSKDGEAQEPAKDILKPGDYIVAFNEEEISGKKELMEDLRHIGGEEVTLDVVRDGETVPVSVTAGSGRLGRL